MRAIQRLGALAAALCFIPATMREARACGGCFHPPTPPMESGTVVTDHQMIFVTSPQQTTLYDMIKYTGSPASFAWVLPIHGTANVGLSSDTVFAALDQLTRLIFTPPVLPPCPVPANCPVCAEHSGAGTGTGGATTGGVTVLAQAVVGPYETVQLQSTDPNALSAWLAANGYTIQQSEQPIIAAYVSEGLDFLAMRLAPGQGVQSMRPVSVTSPGAGMSLPLRMVAAGTGATVGITLWVVSGGRLEPQNFMGFTINPSDLLWDWSAGSSNYTTVQQQKETAFNNAAWQTESSLDVSAVSIENLVLGFGVSPDGGHSISASSEGYTDSDAGKGMTAEQQRQQDLATLFPGGGSSVRITRMRADLSQAALANDLVLQASMDQSPISNVYQLTQSINAPQCPNPPVCPCGNVGGSGASGVTPTTGPSGSSSSSKASGGCAASSGNRGTGALEIFLAAIAGTALVRARVRRKSG